MKKIFLLFIIAFFLVIKIQAQVYVINETCSHNFQDISGTTALTLTSNHANITLPFSFTFYGTASTSLRVSQYGAILFNATTGDIASANGAISNGTATIYPFWDDLATGAGGVYSSTIGLTPNRVHIIQWKLKHSTCAGGGTVNVQVQLYETTNEIAFLYNDLSFGCTAVDYGKSATVGIRGASDYEQYSKDFLFTNTCISYTLCNAPVANISKTACSGGTYTVSVNVTSLGGATGVDITDGTTTYQTNVGTGTYAIPGTFSTTKIFYVKDHNDLVCSAQELFAGCDVCTSGDSPNDLCSSAPLIDLSQPFAGSTNCSYTAGADPGSSCGISINNDSWIKFQAGATDVKFKVDIGECSGSSGVQLIVYSGSCGSLTEITGSCINPSGELTSVLWNFTNLTISNYYYIMIDGYAGDLCDYSFTPISGVVTTPENDVCATATTIVCGDNKVSNTILATADANAGCSGGGTPSIGVWYKFVGNGQQVTVSTDNPRTNFDTEINVYSGSCASLVCIGGNDNGGGTIAPNSSVYTFNSSIGTDYFIYIDGVSDEGQFELTVSCAVLGTTVSGTLKYDNVATTALNNQTVNLVGSAKTTTTDASGNYSFTNVSDGNYTVTPVVTKPWGGVTAMDVTKYQKHIVNTSPLTDLPLLAGDVNSAGGVTITDITPLLQKIVFLTPAWPSSDFVFSSGSVTVTGTPQTVNISALCYGDANKSYVPAAKYELPSILVENSNVMFYENDEFFEIPVLVNSNIDNLSSLTLKFNYDVDAVEISEIVLAENNNMLKYSIQNGEINMVYSNLNTVSLMDKDILFYVKGKIKNLTNKIVLLDNARGEFGDVNDNQLSDISLSIPELSNTTLNLNENNNIISIFPNPANDYLYVNNVKNSKVEIYDIFGKLCLSQEILDNNTKLEINSLSNGTYFIKINKNNKLITQKFNVLK